MDDLTIEDAINEFREDLVLSPKNHNKSVLPTRKNHVPIREHVPPPLQYSRDAYYDHRPPPMSSALPPQVIVQQLPAQQSSSSYSRTRTIILFTVSVSLIALLSYVSFCFYNEYAENGSYSRRDLYHYVEQAKRTAGSFPQGHVTFYAYPKTADEEEDKVKYRKKKLYH